MNNILPQEFHFEDTSDSVRVKTAVGKDMITVDMLLRHHVQGLRRASRFRRFRD
jgi:hypothetical protein